MAVHEGTSDKAQLLLNPICLQAAELVSTQTVQSFSHHEASYLKCCSLTWQAVGRLSEPACNQLWGADHQGPALPCAEDLCSDWDVTLCGQAGAAL